MTEILQIYKHKRLSTLFLFLISFHCISQNLFHGIISEEGSSLKIAGAIVSIEGTSISKNTDKDGKFSINHKLPSKEYIVTIEKEGYDMKFVLIEILESKDIFLDEIKLSLNSAEKKRRKKIARKLRKEKKKKNRLIKRTLLLARKEKEKRNKELERLKKSLHKTRSKKKKKVNFEDTFISPELNSNLLIKYSELLGVTSDKITNFKLYEFIAKWEGIPYLLGGETTEGIDCSSFTQRLYTSVYDLYIERTAQKQFNSKLTDKFQGREFLHEGDLIFFTRVNNKKNIVNHVGIYLQNGKFVHSTSFKRDTGTNGVKISDLNHPFWKKRFLAAGRRIQN